MTRHTITRPRRPGASSPELLDAALAIAGRGWPVFPIRPGQKRPPALHSAARCPGTGACAGGHLGWEQRASTDPDRIRAAWTRGRFNIGLACGPAGLVVLDLDVPHSRADRPPQRWNRGGIGGGPVRDGADVLAALAREAGQPVPGVDVATLTVATARGGRHLYFAAPAGIELRNTEGEHGTRGLGWKLDVRAHGGYVVAPGSITADGPYRLVTDAPPGGLPELPGWLVQRLAPRPPTTVSAPSERPPAVPRARLPAYVAAAVAGERERVADAPSGQHAAVLFVAAVALGQLVGAELLPEPVAAAELHDAATQMRAAATRPCGCTDTEIARTIGNGITAGRERPRRLTTRLTTRSTTARAGRTRR